MGRGEFMVRGIGTTKINMSAKDFAYSELKQQIIDGILRPNQSVIESELSQDLDISRTPLREALQRLELEGLIVRKRNGRMKIAPISVQEATEVFNVRAKLEGIVTAEATDNATKQDIDYLTGIVNQLKQQYIVGNNEGILHFGSMFHSYIYELSGNRTANHILSLLNDHIHRYRRLIPHDTLSNQTDEDEHQIILDFMVEKNALAAQQAVEQHIQQSLELTIHVVMQYEKNMSK